MTTQETGQTIEISHPDGRITARKLVSKGERLRITAGPDRTKLDALLLESLSWQRDSEAVWRLLSPTDGAEPDPFPQAGGRRDVDGPELSISNEYSHVVVSKVRTRDRDGLHIEAPARGTSIDLGPDSLRQIARIEDTFVFSTWFETPFGPEDTPVEGPL